MEVDDIAERPTAVYVVKGIEGACLYVGVTCDPFRRLDEHAARRTFGEHLVTGVEIAWHTTRSSAMTEEAALISERCPLLNKQHNLAERERFSVVDPATRAEIEVCPYEPPRALVVSGSNGRTIRKSVENGTRSDLAEHGEMLRANAREAAHRQQRFDAFATNVAPDMHDDATTIGDVMRARQRKDAA